MARIPEARNIQRKSVSGLRSVSGYSTKDAGSAFDHLARSLQVEADEQTQYQVKTAEADFISRQREFEAQAEKDDDYGTLTERYTKDLDYHANKYSETISIPSVRQAFLDLQKTRIEEGKVRVGKIAFNKERDFERNAMNTRLNSYQKAAIDGTIDYATASKMVDGLLESGVAKNYYSHQEGGSISKAFKDTVAINKLELLNPDDRLAELDKPYTKNLPAGVRAKLIREGKSAQREEKAYSTADEWMGKGYSLADGMAKAAKIKDIDERKAVEKRWAEVNSIKNAGDAQKERELKKSQNDNYEKFSQMILNANTPWAAFTPEQKMMVSAGQQVRLMKYSDVVNAPPSSRKSSDFNTLNNIQVLLGNGRFDEAQDLIHSSSALLTDADKEQYNQKAIDGLTKPDTASQIKSLYTPKTYIKMQLGEKNKGLNERVAREMDEYYTQYQDTHRDSEGNPQLPPQAEWKKHANELIGAATTDVSRPWYTPDSPPTEEEYKGTTTAILEKMDATQQAEIRLTVEQQSAGSIKRINDYRISKGLPVMTQGEIRRLKQRMMEEQVKPKEKAMKGKMLGGFTNKLKNIESKGNYNVVNKYGYTGAYQFGKKTARPYLKKLGKSWTDFKNSPELQDQIFQLSVAHNMKQMEKKNIEPTELNLWIAHNQGLGGLSQILSGKISSKVKKNISTNLPDGGEATADNYIKQWSKRFSSRNV